MSEPAPSTPHDRHDRTADSHDADPDVATARRFALNEDWAATVVGLVLLVLVLTGLLPGWLVP